MKGSKGAKGAANINGKTTARYSRLYLAYDLNLDTNTEPSFLAIPDLHL